MKTNSFFYEIIVDTDSYSGNFEREMAAYAFGCLDVNNMGYEYVEQDVFPLPWACNSHSCYGPLIALDPEERGEMYEKYGNISPTPGFRNNGSGVHLPYAGEEIEGNLWPAYQSVAFRFENGFTPTEDQVKELQERLRGFPKAFTEKEIIKKSPITLTGIRLVRTEVAESPEVEFSF